MRAGTHKHTQAQANTHRHTQAYTQAHTRTRTHTHTHLNSIHNILLCIGWSATVQMGGGWGSSLIERKEQMYMVRNHFGLQLLQPTGGCRCRGSMFAFGYETTF